MKKSKYIGFRISHEEFVRLEEVQDNIARVSRGQKPDIAEIIRSIIGWGNKELVSQEERSFIAGNIPALHGDALPDSRKKNKAC
jgi:hypothetical protein